MGLLTLLDLHDERYLTMVLFSVNVSLFAPAMYFVIA